MGVIGGWHDREGSLGAGFVAVPVLVRGDHRGEIVERDHGRHVPTDFLSAHA
jgi:hypothetical protein